MRAAMLSKCRVRVHSDELMACAQALLDGAIDSLHVVRRNNAHLTTNRDTEDAIKTFLGVIPTEND